MKPLQQIQKIFLSLFLLSWLGLGVIEAKSLPKKLVLAKFHADWCPSCKRWDSTKPGFYELKDYAQKKGILVVVLDLTNNKTRKQAALLAKKAHIFPVYQKYQNATGFALLINPRDQKVWTVLESGSANLYFFDSWFSDAPTRTYQKNVARINQALAQLQ